MQIIGLIGISIGVIYFIGLFQKSKSQVKVYLKIEVDALGPVKKDKNGRLEFDQYKQVFALLHKYSKVHLLSQKKVMLERRRAALKEEDMDQYQRIVLRMIQVEEKVFKQITKQVANLIKTPEAVLMKTHHYYMSLEQPRAELMDI